MGLGNHEGGKFITIFNGKFTQRVPESTEGAVQRTNKDNKVVFEKYYDNFTGKLVGISTRESSYGKQWLFAFKDELEVYNLALSYSSGFASAFLKMLPNIDITKEMLVSPSVEEVDGKKKSSLFVKQSGAWIKSAFTKDNPNGLPKWKQVTVKGQLVWDDSEAMAFLEEMVKRDIIPKLPKQEATASTPAQQSAEELAEELGEKIGEEGGENDF